MFLTISELLLLMLGFLVIATLYSSVGFGGGSSYLALLALVFVSFFTIRSMALLCNLVVVSASSYLYWKNGHLDFKKFLPFIVTSIPLAFIGARFRLSENVFFIILGGALIISAIALMYQTNNQKKSILCVWTFSNTKISYVVCFICTTLCGNGISIHAASRAILDSSRSENLARDASFGLTAPNSLNTTALSASDETSTCGCEFLTIYWFPSSTDWSTFFDSRTSALYDTHTSTPTTIGHFFEKLIIFPFAACQLGIITTL